MREDSGRCLIERFPHHLPAILVSLAEPVNQRIVVAHRQEQGDDALIVGGRVAHHQPAQRARFLDQRAWCDHVTEPQSRRQGFRQAADVDNAFAGVEAFQRRRRLADES